MELKQQSFIIHQTNSMKFKFIYQMIKPNLFGTILIKVLNKLRIGKIELIAIYKMLKVLFMELLVVLLTSIRIK